jgi:hypothetical protein
MGKSIRPGYVVGDDLAGIPPDEHPMRGTIPFDRTCQACYGGDVLVIFARFSMDPASWQGSYLYEIACRSCGHRVLQTWSQQTAYQPERWSLPDNQPEELTG